MDSPEWHVPGRPLAVRYCPNPHPMSNTNCQCLLPSAAAAKCAVRFVHDQLQFVGFDRLGLPDSVRTVRICRDFHLPRSVCAGLRADEGWWSKRGDRPDGLGADDKIIKPASLL